MNKNLLGQTLLQPKKKVLLLAGLTALSGILLLGTSFIFAQFMQSALQGESSFLKTAPAFLVLFLFFCLRAGSNFYRQQQMRQLSQVTREAMRKKLHLALLARAADIEPGRLLTLCTETVDALDEYFSQVLPELLNCIVLIPLIFVASLWFDPLTALLFAITLPIAPFLLYLIGRVTKTASEAQWQKLLQLTTGFYELLHGMVTLKIFRQTEQQYQRLCQLSEDFAATSLKVLQIAFVSSFALELITTLAIAIIAVGIGLRLLAGQIAFDTAFFILLITPEFYQPLRNSGLSFHAWMNAQTAEKDLQAFLAKAAITSDAKPKKSFNNQKFALCCQNISYRYPQTNADVIAKLSFALPKNQKTILCGESGSGKSTLLKLCAGLLTPTTGMLQYAEDTSISYVPQTPHLFAASLRENISLFDAADDQEIITALAQAGLSSWLSQLPQSLDTRLGDGGLPLSRGQLQRLGLTRAFWQKRSLVLLDEPTAGLDAKTEQQILAALSKFSQGHTLLIASHRPAVLAWGDNVIEMEVP